MLLFVVCCANTSCGLHEKIKEEQAMQDKSDALGVKRNSQRKQLGIPLLPVSNWTGGCGTHDSTLAGCTFTNNIQGIDSLPRHEEKQIYLYKQGLSPVREMDTYYSGRKFIENDPDFYGWERVEIIHTYVNDTLRLRSTEPTILRKGKTAVLHAARREFITSNIHPEGEYWTLLKEQEISLVQADSVLKAWKLSRFKD